jgi:hypothetical protein
MKMIGHNDERVQFVESSLAAIEQLIEQDLRDFRLRK